MMILTRIKNSLLFRFHYYKSEGRKKILFVYRYFIKNKSGINLIGYFSYTLGIAEVGRFFAQNVEKADIPLSIYDLKLPSRKQLDTESLKDYKIHFSLNPPYHRNVFFINADNILDIKELLPELFIGRYNSAVFFWEFNDYFNFPQAFTVLNEVFAFTEFIATAIRKTAPNNVKVTKLPFPFIKNWEITKPTESVRNQYNIPLDSFVFIFNFDFFSVYDRKNPEAIIKAFAKAFNKNDKVCLVLKTIHAEAKSKNNDSFKSIVEKLELKDKIIIINDNLERNDFMNVLNASDAYVSLHRSEGLGLGMLEAMAIGKPVIGTNFGGNTDFMNSNNSLLVDYNLIPVAEDAPPYKAGWLWADANVEDAANYMLKLYNDRTFATELGQRAKNSIEEQFNNSDLFQNTLKSWMKS